MRDGVPAGNVRAMEREREQELLKIGERNSGQRGECVYCKKYSKGIGV